MKMRFLRSFIVLFLSCTLHSACKGSPLTWQLQEAVNEEVLEREARSVGSGAGSGDEEAGSGSGDYPCGDDEDCTGMRPTAVEYPPPKIESMRVTTTITARYVSTVVVTEMRNSAPVSRDSNFQFRLSKEAFISDFFMEINGRIYQAEVREKEEAQKAYNEARRRGQTAAQVKQSGDDFTKFATDVNLSPNTTAVFHLTFQELLRRKNGLFQHRVNIYPKEVVSTLRADVFITEPQGISFANISWVQDEHLPTGFLDHALTVTRKSDSTLHASLIPSVEDQLELSETGLQGDLVINYDVVHDTGAGHIEVVNGYFVHHISPAGLPKTSKNVVFVIDISGSMDWGSGNFGSKIEQTKLAMSTIIDEIREFDRFNIICFADVLTEWESGLVDGSPENKERAKSFMNSLRADGGTDIYMALEQAVNRLKESLSEFSEGLPMIIILTDGEPTSGITDRNTIVQLTTDMIQGEMALFSLAFGGDADYKLLEKLSGFNQGLARKIYPDSSPSLQLEGFYKEVANPLLYNVDIRYTDGAVEGDTLTTTNFISYFEGTELVIAGKLKDDFMDAKNEISAVVSGNSFDVQLEWELVKTIKTTTGGTSEPVLKPHQVDNFAERLWAYVTVKDLLNKYHISLSSLEKDLIREKATRIALKYKFVTPLTSLIVIKPEDDDNYDDILDIDDSEEAEEEQEEASFLNNYQYDVQYSTSIHTLSIQAKGHPAPPASVYGDPHFTVPILGENTSLCFEAKGREGMIVNLIRDPKLGITINGNIHTIKNASNPEKLKSYLSAFGFTLGNHQVTVTSSEIVTETGVTLPWTSEARLSFGDFSVTVHPPTRRMIISHPSGILMHVRRSQDRRHADRAWKEANSDHLALFIKDTSGFTNELDGLIGQFYSPGKAHLEYSEPDAGTTELSGMTPLKTAVVILDGVKVPVIWHERNHRKCWHAGRDGLGKLNPDVFEAFSL